MPRIGETAKSRVGASMRCRAAVLTTLLLGACTAQSLPFTIERGATLPADRYPALERLAAKAEPVTYRKVKPVAGRPEPYWVYSVDPGLNLAALPLQIGPFTAGETDKAREVAAALPGQVADALRGTRLFASVGTEPAPGGLVLSGVVTRATTEEVDGGQNVAAMTQVEARLTRNGTVVGVMQVNAVQLDAGAGSPLAILIYSAVQGSRAAYVGTKFRDMFEGVAAGRTEGIDIETFSKRFIFAPVL